MFRPPAKRWILANIANPTRQESGDADCSTPDGSAGSATAGGWDACELAAEIGCSPLAAALLIQRGICNPQDAHRFLNPSLDDLPDASLLPDAEAAADRIAAAIARKEPIIIHGDYDSDGVTSAALLMRLLSRLGANVRVHVPHRIQDGYDIRREFIESARRQGHSLIITCDCGIQRYDEVELARTMGIDVIITDHHKPGDRIPRAVAVVNPNRHDAVYPFRHLAGVGVAFRLGELVVRKLGLSVTTYRRAYVDLAAIGTVTDAMPLLEDNRAIVAAGLRRIPQTPKVGIRALLASAQMAGRAITSRDIAFGIGPRLNAVGRIGDAKVALELLLTTDEAEASALAGRLEAANAERRKAQDRILQEALQQLATDEAYQATCIVLKGSNWHQGVVGIVATKIAEIFYRPTILIAADGVKHTGRGSARTIPPLDIHKAISACRAYLTEFGGHSHAAGLALPLANFEAFREAMNAVTAQMLTPEDLQPVLRADVELDPGDATPELLAELAKMEPWGTGNEEPIFLAKGVEVADCRQIGRDGEHLKMLLNTPRGLREAVYWRAFNNEELLNGLHPSNLPVNGEARWSRVDLCYRIQENTYQSEKGIQLCVVDMRKSE